MYRMGYATRVMMWVLVVMVSVCPVIGAQGITVHSIRKIHVTKGGMEIQCDSGTIQIVALREDVLRITISPTSVLPEDASWAVLSASRVSRVDVTRMQNAEAVGFDTQLLHVRVDRSTLGITVTDSAGNVISRDARPVEFNKGAAAGFQVWKEMPEDEHYFGLGDKTGPLDRRGNSYVMWNTDAYRFQEGTDPLYKSIPFFIGFRAGRSYGLFLDNTWRTTFDFGKQSRNTYTFGSDGGPLTYYLLYGPQPKAVEADYAWLTGTTPLPPLWSFGFQQSRYSYPTEQRVREVADHFRNDRIPADALYLDIDYQQKNRPFTVNGSRFPNFTAFVEELAKKQFHLIVVADLHIANAPGQNYAPFDTGVSGDHFIKSSDGKMYSGDVWPGLSVFPDFTQKQTRTWFGELYRPLYMDGISGFWDDMNEPSVFNVASKTIPLDATSRIDEPGFSKRVTTQRETHNLTGIENARATYDGMLAIKPNQRPFVLTRATYAGGQRYGATWTGDDSSSWNHLRMSTPMLESLGLSGFYMVGDDIGGFAGSPTMDLLTKWLEVGAFNPMDRDHTEKFTNDQEPWVGGPAQEDIRRKYINERYRLLPYLYSLAEEASRTGVPILRPLFLEFPEATEDKHPLDLDAGNEFLVGPSLLVAPAPYPDEVQDYPVTFPSPIWYDYWTGRLVDRSKPTKTPISASPVSTGAPIGMDDLQTTMIHPSQDLLPVFVRGGTILPVQPVVQSTAQNPEGPLELRVYPGPDCKGTLYLDDGTTFDYTKGVFLRENFSCTAVDHRLRLKIAATSGSYPAWWKQIDVVVFNWPDEQVTAKLDGHRIAGGKYNATQKALIIQVPQVSAGEELVVTGTPTTQP